MRSASDDLTTKARIRDAAILAIGRSGFAATTVRSIAADVGVSPALLLHHFGSKDGLRQACDDHVLAWYAAQVAEFGADGSPGTMLSMLDRTPELLPFADYVRRSLTDGGAFAQRMFDALVQDTVDYLDRAEAAGRVRPTEDQRGRALTMIVTSVGAQVLATYLTPPDTPPELLARAASDRLLGPGLELYTHGLFTDSEYLDAYRRYRGETDQPS